MAEDPSLGLSLSMVTKRQDGRRANLENHVFTMFKFPRVAHAS